MIKIEEVVAEAICDSCHEGLYINECGVHYGRLQANFGYGSELDSTSANVFYLCEKCYAKVIIALAVKYDRDFLNSDYKLLGA